MNFLWYKRKLPEINLVWQCGRAPLSRRSIIRWWVWFLLPCVVCILADAQAQLNPARIINMSVRSNAGTDSQTLIVGWVIGGTMVTGNKSLLVRAVGPSLAQFSIVNFLVDPRLVVFSGADPIATNDDWAGDLLIVSTELRLGAFPLGALSSKDAALLLSDLAPGLYTAHATGVGGGTGVALLEIYDASSPAVFDPSTPRLINVSARTQVGTGENILIAGFVMAGSDPIAVLIRGVGPSLTQQGVTGVLADPKLTLFSGATPILSNDNWSGDRTLAAAFSAAGAFALDETSKDAAIVAILGPGIYTAHVSGVGNTTGVALVEVYELPSVAPTVGELQISSSANFHNSNQIEFTVTATTPFGVPLSFELLVNNIVAVPWQAANLISWSPTEEFHGSATFVVKVRDSSGSTSTQTADRYVYRTPPSPL